MDDNAEKGGGLYPVFLKLEGRDVLVVGAGSVATRKVAVLLDAGARVRVVAPDAHPDVQERARTGSVAWAARPFVDTDVEGAWLVVAATADPEVQRRVARAAEAQRTFVLAVDDVRHATAYAGALVRRPPFTIAISSSGAAPALTRLVREVMESFLPNADWIDHAVRLRERWLVNGTPVPERFADLVRELVAKGR